MAVIVFTHFQMNKFIKNEAELLIPNVAGSVYYKDLAREKARIRNSDDLTATQRHETMALRKSRYVKKVKRARRPPSMKPRTTKMMKKALEKLRETQQLAEKKAYIAVSCMFVY